MPFGDPLKKEACLSAILTLNLKFPYIKKHAFWRFPKKRSMPFGDLNPKPKILLHKEASGSLWLAGWLAAFGRQALAGCLWLAGGGWLAQAGSGWLQLAPAGSGSGSSYGSGSGWLWLWLWLAGSGSG